MPIKTGEAYYCEGNEAELAAVGNVAVATIGERLFLRGPLAGCFSQIELGLRWRRPWLHAAIEGGARGPPADWTFRSEAAQIGIIFLLTHWEEGRIMALCDMASYDIMSRRGTRSR